MISLTGVMTMVVVPEAPLRFPTFSSLRQSEQSPPRREMQGARARTLRAVHILTVIRPRLAVPARKTLPNAHAPARLVHGREGREGKTSPVSKHITTGRTGACLGKDPHDHHPQADATHHGGTDPHNNTTPRTSGSSLRKDPNGKSDHHRRADATYHCGTDPHNNATPRTGRTSPIDWDWRKGKTTPI